MHLYGKAMQMPACASANFAGPRLQLFPPASSDTYLKLASLPRGDEFGQGEARSVLTRSKPTKLSVLVGWSFQKWTPDFMIARPGGMCKVSILRPGFYLLIFQMARNCAVC
jgi:hypothetical protein